MVTPNPDKPVGNKNHDTRDTMSTVKDHSQRVSDQACIVYKFQSRPPYEGFILILVIIVIAILLIWWLIHGLRASKQ